MKRASVVRPMSFAIVLGTMLLAATALRPLFAQPAAPPSASPLATSACRDVLDALTESEGLDAELTYADVQAAYALLEDETVAAEWERIATDHPTNLVAGNLHATFGRVRYLFHATFGDCAEHAPTDPVAMSDEHVHVLNRTIDLHRRAQVCVASLPR